MFSAYRSASAITKSNMYKQIIGLYKSYCYNTVLGLFLFNKMGSGIAETGILVVRAIVVGISSESAPRT
uniref:Uncharacterized protein n=1 Tax=Pararge aegeria TaxID=116150 RepID=S4PFM2_9NEOP